jgi:hypothetical protein
VLEKKACLCAAARNRIADDSKPADSWQQDGDSDITNRALPAHRVLTLQLSSMSPLHMLPCCLFEHLRLVQPQNRDDDARRTVRHKFPLHPASARQPPTSVFMDDPK